MRRGPGRRETPYPCPRSRPRHRPTFHCRSEARSLLPRARKYRERRIPPPEGSQGTTQPGRARPAAYLVEIQERRREPRPRTVASTTHSCCRSASHSNPGKMARQQGCRRGACVSAQRQGAGSGALGPHPSSNSRSLSYCLR